MSAAVSTSSPPDTAPSRPGDPHGTRPRGARETGSASLEIVVLFPVVLLLLFTVIQGALWYHARNVASAAASEGLRAGRVETGSADAGRQRAADFLADSGGTDVLTAATVDAAHDGTRVRVRVTGRSIGLLPGVPGPGVDQSATGPVERFTSAVSP